MSDLVVGHSEGCKCTSSYYISEPTFDAAKKKIMEAITECIDRLESDNNPHEVNLFKSGKKIFKLEQLSDLLCEFTQTDHYYHKYDMEI